MKDSYEVLIVGAGASGLSALRQLRQAGRDAVCVEARDRIGGRVLTINDPKAPLPIELGPEFVHGRPPESWELIRSGNLTVFDCEEHSVHIADGHVQKQSNAWEQVGAITEEMKRVAESGRDLPFAEFLDQTRFSAEAKQLATSYVEGFNAADRRVIGVAALARDARAAAQIEGDRNSRIASGYRALIEELQGGEAVHLNHQVERVEWSRGQASVMFQGRSITAKRVVITVPLGVLQAGDIAFLPEPARVLDAARAIRFGHVVRVVMRFNEPWWEENEELGDAGFWLSREHYFPTWWTTLPVRSSLLTGWCAGPRAELLLGASREEVIGRALDDLAKVTRVNRKRLEQMLQAAHFHDWHADCFSRGAYSYLPAGSLAQHKELAIPVEDTLFFAGEATEISGHGGTVHGAIASGRRAAQQVIRSFE